jgi:hypothetical protein
MADFDLKNSPRDMFLFRLAYEKEAQLDDTR